MRKVVQLPRIEASKAVILARVSSTEQEDGYSIDAQKHRLQQYCDRRGLNVLRVFEITESSTRGDRKKFMEMISFCKAQRQPVAIVADKVDRVQRSFKEYPLLNELIQGGKIELHFNTEGYVIHKESISQERLMWSFGVILAQSYVDNLRDHVKRSIDQKIRVGEYVSRAPLGYLNVREYGRADIVVDSMREAFIRRMFREFSTGAYTIKHMTKTAKEWGLRSRTNTPVSRAQIYEILTNPFYYGMMRVKGVLYPHRYPPLIPKHEFDECQAVLSGWNKKRFKYAGKEFAFRGILTCKLNSRTVSSFTKKKTYANGETGEWTYLQSWKDHDKLMYVREDIVLAQAEKALAALAIPAEHVEAFERHLRDCNRTETDFVRRRVEELRKEEARLVARIAALTELLIDKAISQEDYETRRIAYRQRQIEITNEITANASGDDGFRDSMSILLQVCRDAAILFKGSNAEQKRKLLNFVFLNLQLDGKNLCFSYRNPFQQVVEHSKSEKWWELLDVLRNTPEIRQAIIDLANRFQELVPPNVKEVKD